MLKRENEERQRELRDLEAFVKKENAERKAAEDRIQSVLDAENEKRMKEAAALKDKMEKEKKEMQVMTIFNFVSFGTIVYFSLHIQYDIKQFTTCCLLGIPGTRR